MTKKEAIDAMRCGKRVRHKYFDADEWVTMEGGSMLLEAGATRRSSGLGGGRRGGLTGVSLLNSD